MPDYTKMLEEMARLNRTLDPIRQHLEINRSIENLGLTYDQLSRMAEISRHWQDLIDQSKFASRWLEENIQIHPTWLDRIPLTIDRIGQVQDVMKLSLEKTAHRAIIAEELFARANLGNLQRTLALSESKIQQFQNEIGDLNSAYNKLTLSIRTPAEVAFRPVFALSGSTREILVTNYTFDKICNTENKEKREDVTVDKLITEVNEEISDLPRLLQKLNPALVKPYIGARSALYGKNPDRARHVLSSLRELWNHLLRQLAPDELIRPWIPIENKDFLDKGKPTRRARILYICRNLNHEPLSEFVDKNTRAFVEMWDLFNQLHNLKLNLTDEQLHTLMIRTKSWLLYILQIWEGDEERC